MMLKVSFSILAEWKEGKTILTEVNWNEWMEFKGFWEDLNTQAWLDKMEVAQADVCKGKNREELTKANIQIRWVLEDEQWSHRGQGRNLTWLS